MIVRSSLTAVCLWSVACGCGMAEPTRPDKHEDAQNAGAKAVPENVFSFSFPADLNRSETKGLKAELEVSETSAAEGYFVDIYAVVDDPNKPGGLKSIKVGDTAIFKPLRQGEKAVVYMPLPDKEAWRTDGQLWLTYKIAAGKPERAVPFVKMKFLQVEPRHREK